MGEDGQGIILRWAIIRMGYQFLTLSFGILWSYNQHSSFGYLFRLFVVIVFITERSVFLFNFFDMPQKNSFRA